MSFDTKQCNRTFFSSRYAKDWENWENWKYWILIHSLDLSTVWREYYALNCIYQMKYDPCSYERNLCNCVKKPEKKIQDYNEVSTHDLAIPVAMKPLTLGAGQLC